MESPKIVTVIYWRGNSIGFEPCTPDEVDRCIKRHRRNGYNAEREGVAIIRNGKVEICDNP